MPTPPRWPRPRAPATFPAAGIRIEAGRVLGYVGTTGNAKGTPPHLLYGLYGLDSAINPYPLRAGPSTAIDQGASRRPAAGVPVSYAIN